MSDFKKIIVFRYRFLGDTILTVPFLEQLKQLYPNSEVVLLTSSISGQLLRNCPYVDRLMFVGDNRKHKYESTSDLQVEKGFWKLWMALKAEKFDIAYVLKRSFSSALVACLAGIPKRIGFDTEARGLLLTQKVSFDPTKHEIYNFLRHLPSEYRNISPLDTKKYFWSSESEQQKARQVLQPYQQSKKIVLSPSSAHHYKSWVVDKWASLLNNLKQRGYMVILSGSSADRHYNDMIQTQAGHSADIDLSQMDFALRDNVAIYEQCDLMISVDSGPMHLAASVGLPVIGLFGGTNPDRWHPWGTKYKILTSKEALPCRPCNLKLSCEEKRQCITDVTVEQVMCEIETFLVD